MITAPTPLAAASHPPERETWMQKIARTRYFSLSLILHLLALVVFGTIIIQHASNDAPEFTTTESLFSTDIAEPQSDEPLARIPEPAGGEVLEIKTPSLAMSAITTSAPNTNFTLNVTATIGNSVGNIAGSTGGQGGGPGGFGKGIGMGGGTKVKFLGKVMTVKDVVLVLDVSSSMISGVKNEKTYEVLEREACNVIRGLKVENKFGVVVFSKEAKVYQEHLVAAHNDEKQRAVSWLKQMTPLNTRDPRVEDDVKNFHHGTRADLALKAAFDLNPDLIFFVSDGEPTGTTVPAIMSQVTTAQTANNKLIDIHTIAYLADSGQQFMKDLAAQNRGTFREVNPKDIK